MKERDARIRKRKEKAIGGCDYFRSPPFPLFDSFCFCLHHPESPPIYAYYVG